MKFHKCTGCCGRDRLRKRGCVRSACCHVYERFGVMNPAWRLSAALAAGLSGVRMDEERLGCSWRRSLRLPPIWRKSAVEHSNHDKRGARGVRFPMPLRLPSGANERERVCVRARVCPLVLTNAAACIEWSAFSRWAAPLTAGDDAGTTVAPAVRWGSTPVMVRREAAVRVRSTLTRA